MSLVYLNGEFKKLAEANINVLDRGFIFADGVYEVIPVFNRKIFRFHEHMQRLQNSLQAIYMDNPMSLEEWHSIIDKLIESRERPEQSIYIQVTRGISERDHDIGLADSPTIFAMSRPINKQEMSNGIKAITHEDIRWQYCDIKAITLLPSVLLRHKAREAESKEAILIREGIVTEGAASNVFICKDDEIITPPKNRFVLPGITRDLVIEILSTNNISHSESIISESQLFDAEEIWVTSSTWEIVPVVELNGYSVGSGQSGPLWDKVNRLYQEFKQTNCS